jgi:ribose transport system substrate-binding protein
MKKKSILISCLSALMLVTTLTGCNNSNDNLKIAVIAKSQNAEFWDTMNKGAESACEEVNAEIMIDAPLTEEDINDQILLIEKAIDEGVNGIVLAPLDTNLLNDAIEEANDAGIKVVTIDSSVTSEFVECAIGTDNSDGGSMACRYALEALENEGKTLDGGVCVIKFMPNAQTANERHNGFVTTLSTLAPDAKIVADFSSNNDRQATKEQLEKVIEENPNLSLIFATNETVANGVCDALLELNRTDIVCIGFDSSDVEISNMKAGVLNGMVVQNPYNMGYFGVKNVIKLINGENDVTPTVNTGAVFVSPDNFNNQEIQKLVYPNK